jgi:hypothetical protein
MPPHFRTLLLLPLFGTVAQAAVPSPTHIADAAGFANLT